MEQGESDHRWQKLSEVRGEFDDPPVVLPMLASRIDGKPLKASKRARRFAEGLAFDDAWTGISDARRKAA